MRGLETSTLVASWTKRALEWGERQGVAGGPLLIEVGVERAVLDDPAGRVPFSAHATLVRLLSERLDDPGVGVSIGASAGAADFGVVSLLAESSATLGDALARVRRFNALASEASRMDFFVEGKDLVITDGHLPDGRPVPDALAEATLAYYATMIRLATGVREPLTAVSFAHRAHRGWSRERRGHFAARLRFDAPLNALRMPAQLLDAPFVSSRPELGAHLTALADRLERDLGPVDALVHRVAAHVRTTLAAGPAPIERVARAMGISTRSLQRRLEAEGVSYLQVVDQVRRSEVEAAMGNPSLSLDSIAERAGYSDVRALRRASVRWFGASASARRGSM